MSVTLTLHYLRCTTLANGGLASSIGQSGNAPANLVLDGGTLQYASTGAAAGTDRLFTLTINGGALDASGSDSWSVNGNGAGAANAIAFAGSGARTLTLTGSNPGANLFAPILGDAGAGQPTALTKAGAGRWTVSNANPYSGATTVFAGTLEISGSISGTSAVVVRNGVLELSAPNAINSVAPIAMGDGTLNTGGVLRIKDGLSATVETLGVVTLNFASTLDFGNGSGNSLLAAGFGAHAAGGPKLTILNWNGTANQAGTSGVDDRLIFTGDSLTLASFNAAFGASDISFNGIDGYALIPVDASHFEVVAVPEPSSLALLGGLGIFALGGWRFRATINAE
jgi:autotransporter-associated beta strand protein